MLTTSSPTLLYPLDECPELMADGCLCDEQHNLIFLSVWGRDTAIHEFLARLTLGRDEQGLDQFHLRTQQDLLIPLFVGNVDRLEKRTTRIYRRTLFGSMIHLWLIDRSCIQPDKANAKALAILPREAPNHIQRLWTLVQETCPLPLLDHWRDTVLEFLQAQAMLVSLPVVLGEFEGYRLTLDVPALTTALGELIRNEKLGISPSKQAFDTQLRRVA